MIGYRGYRVLQWGHDKIVMEVQLGGFSSCAVGLLQWGHDKIVMEVDFGKFNLFFKCELQWGHDKIVMEVIHTSRIST